MSVSKEIILEVKNLSVAFNVDGQVNTAIENLDFELFKGETLAIVGESGSGKSVTSLAIMGLLPIPPAIINNGEILFEQKNLLINNNSSFVRGNKIAMIFQEPMTSLNPLMKCGNQVCEAIILHKKCNYNEAKQKTLKLFNEVKIPNPEIAFNKFPHELSGGQKQRVMIAIAMSCEPNIIIADEPTTALDVMVQDSILDLLKDLQKLYGLSILFITHDLGLVKNFAHRTLVMYKGKKVEINTTEHIFSSPQELYTKALINCRPVASKRLKVLPTVSDYLENKIRGNENIISAEHFVQSNIDLAQHEEVLRIENLNLSYTNKKNVFGKSLGYYQALHNICLCIKKGETVGLVGESGCGKTTLGKAIVKLEKYNSGNIFFKGKDIYNNENDFNRIYPQKVQIIFQDPYSSLNPRLTIGEAIKEPMDYYNIGEKKNRLETVKILLQKVGLFPEHYNRYPHEFSGGQRQRISIARALAMKPEFIICDESVSALDISIQAQVLNLLNDLKEEFNLTLLFITHDLSVVNHFCNRVVVMQQGKIIEENNTLDLFKNPTQDYTKQLLKLVH